MTRLILYAIGFACTFCLLLFTPIRNIPFITKCGRNSLIIYVLHRPITILIHKLIPAEEGSLLTTASLVIIAIVSVLICNSKHTIFFFNCTVEKLTKFIISPRITVTSGLVLFVLLTVSLGAKRTYYELRKQLNPEIIAVAPSELKPMSARHQNQLKSCFRISYIGDLVFLSPQIHKAYNQSTGTHDFSEIFTHTKDIFRSDDLSIAVLEGPVANSKYLSLTDCMDEKPIRLNYPDTLLDNIKDAGIDLVTTATNHMFDQHLQGAIDTVNKLNQKGIQFTGSNAQPEKPRHKIIELSDNDGNTCRIAVLSYTYGSNYVNENEFFKPPLNAFASCLVEPCSSHYDQALERVKEDFRKASADAPDCIIVMPHMGTQFQHTPDNFQKHWCNIFIECGADVILADHPHATQPIEWRKSSSGKHKSLIVYSPGNYANSFTLYDGDAVSIVELYIDKNTGKPTASAFIPMWVSAHGIYKTGQYIPYPIALLAKGGIDAPLSNQDWDRLEQVHPIITKSMGGMAIPLHAASLRFLQFADEPDTLYRDSHELGDTLPPHMLKSPLYQACASSKHICFVGDSITEGTMNRGYGWHEPLTATLPKATRISTFAKGSMTSSYFLDNSDRLGQIQANLYVMAYGTNDIRYRNAKVCAMTPLNYVKNIEKTVSRIREHAPHARFAFIAPWCSYIHDKNCVLNDDTKDALIDAYSQELQAWCVKNGHIFSNPNSILRKHFYTYHAAYPHWVDDIHPNGTRGIKLYTHAALEGSYPPEHK